MTHLNDEHRMCVVPSSLDEHHLARLQWVGMLAVSLLIAIGSGGYFTFSYLQESEERLALLEKNAYQAQSLELKMQMEKTHQDLDYLRKTTESVLRQSIQEHTERAYTLVETLYTQQKDKMPRPALEKLILETLRPLRFFEGRGYYFVDTLEGQCLLLPTNPKLEGTSFWDNQDPTGHYIMRGLVQATQNPEQAGYSRYYWYPPNDKIMRDKLSYVRAFKPFNWVLGAGEYTYKIEETLQRQALSQLRARSFGQNGYFVIFSKEGKVLLAPGNPSDEGLTLSELRKPAQKVANQLYQAGLKQTGWVRYDWPMPQGHIHLPKLAYVSQYPAWNWIIAATAYTNGIQQSIQTERESLKAGIWNKMITGFLVVLFTTLISIIFSWYFSRWLKALMQRYQATLKEKNEELEQKAHEIEHLAFYDTLTELPNRRLLLQRLAQYLEKQTLSKQWGAVLFIDLDHFKQLNDTRGHDIGDLLLIEVSRRLEHSIQALNALPSRLGGDEFVILIMELGLDYEQAEQKTHRILKKIHEQLSQPYLLEGIAHESFPSIGIALFNETMHYTPETLLKEADLAMYSAKKAGRNTFYFCNKAEK